MKNNLILIAAVGTALLFSSCKKDFVCECTETSTGSTNANVMEYTIKDAKKTHAKAQCVTTESEYTDGNTITTYTNTCELK